MNDLQRETIKELQNILPQSHFINIKVRINGEWREYEGDFLKELLCGQIEPPVSDDFCGNCTYLTVTEEEQNFHPEKKDDIHFCKLFNRRVLHLGEHPRLPKLEECKLIGGRKE